jgi:hypothetical protein
MQLSKLQVLDATAWKGLTTENHLGAIFRQEPQKASDMIMFMQASYFGNNIDTVLARYPVKLFEDDRAYTWELMSQAIDNVELIEARIDGTAITPFDEVGKNYSEFELVFPIDWFSDTEQIVGERNELYPILIIEEGRPEGTNTVYKCRLNTGNPDLFVPYEELVRGKRFSGEFAPVERTLSRKGRQIRHKSHMAMTNDFSQIRIQKKTPGNLKGRKMGTVIFDPQSKTPFKIWEQYESFMFNKEFREDMNRLLMFGTSNKAEDGSFKIKGKSGYEIVQGSGIREQMQSSNTSYYSSFSIEELTSRLLDLSENKFSGDQREFVLRTGERGAYQFHKELERFSQLYQPLRNMDRMYSVKDGMFKMAYGYGGQFIEYIGPNGIKVNISVDSMYDDRNRNKIMHPDGGVTESYRYDILDMGTTNGEPNIQRVAPSNYPYVIHRYIPGLRHPFDPDGAITAVGTAEDGWEEHKMFIGGAIVRDPSRTAAFVYNDTI